MDLKINNFIILTFCHIPIMNPSFALVDGCGGRQLVFRPRHFFFLWVQELFDLDGYITSPSTKRGPEIINLSKLCLLFYSHHELIMPSKLVLLGEHSFFRPHLVLGAIIHIFLPRWKIYQPQPNRPKDHELRIWNPCFLLLSYLRCRRMRNCCCQCPNSRNMCVFTNLFRYFFKMSSLYLQICILLMLLDEINVL